MPTIVEARIDAESIARSMHALPQKKSELYLKVRYKQDEPYLSTMDRLLLDARIYILNAQEGKSKNQYRTVLEVEHKMHTLLHE